MEDDGITPVAYVDALKWNSVVMVIVMLINLQKLAGILAVYSRTGYGSRLLLIKMINCTADWIFELSAL